MKSNKLLLFPNNFISAQKDYYESGTSLVSAQDKQFLIQANTTTHFAIRFLLLDIM